MKDRKTLNNVLLGFLATETLCSTYLLKWPEMAVWNSLLYFISGIGIAVTVLFMPRVERPRLRMGYGREAYAKPALAGLASLLILYFSLQVMRASPIDYHQADMLPVIKSMNQRMLSGQIRHVYDRIPDIWNGSDPIYLPAMWIPFAPAVELGIDLRWISAGCLLAVAAFLIMVLPLRKISSLPLLGTAALLLGWLLTENETHGFISFSEDAVVALYYFLLVISLYSEQIWLISIAVCLCLFSRYALIGWIPAFLVFLWLNGRKKQAFIFIGFGIVFFVMFFVFPFGWNSFLRLTQLPARYVDFAKRVWNDSPEVFTGYLGFARYFVPDRMKELHHLLVSLSFTVPSAFMCLCLLVKRKLRLSHIELATLKVTVVVFYNFMMVPYLYLFFTSSFISLAIVLVLLSEPVEQEFAVAELSG